MKKGFLFGLGIFMAGLTFAIVSSVSMGTKEAGNTLTAEELNQVINTLTGIYNDEGNYVGIGVSAPEAKLDVDGTIRANEICDEAGDNCQDISSGWAAGGADNWETGASGIYYSEVAPINKVGIGTTNPSYTLDIVGDINLTGAIRQNGTKILDGGSMGTGSATKGICSPDNEGSIAYEEFGGSGNFYGCRQNAGNYEWIKLSN